MNDVEENGKLYSLALTINLAILVFIYHQKIP